MAGSDERRSHPRITTSARVRWRLADTARGDTLKDISVAGAAVTSSAPVEVGEEIRFELVDALDQRVVAGLGRVIWKRTDPPVFGISFVSVGIDKGTSLG